MRSGLVCLLAVTGCNSIFGSHDVINGSKDADVRPKDAAPYKMFLVGVNVDTTTNADPTQVMPTTTGLATSTNVMAGMLGAALMPVENVSGDGSFTIPYELAQGVYRIVYTPPDGVPVEIQGKMQNATFAVPSVGRPDAMVAPANAQIGDLTPMNGPMPSYANLHVFSIGTFAVRIAGAVNRLGSSFGWTPNANVVDGIQSISGGLYTPESAKGDRLVIVDGSSATPDVANGFSIGTIANFSSGFATPTLTPWKTVNDVGNQTLSWAIPIDTSQHEVSTRVAAVAPTPDWTNNISGNFIDVPPFIYAGVVPTTKLPNFVESGRGYGSSPLNHWAARGYGGLGMPIFLPLSRTASDSSFDMVHVFNGTDAPAFPPAIYMEFSRSKVVQGVTLTAGIHALALPDATNKAQVPFSAGLASQGITLNGVDIFTETNGTTPVPTAPAMDLVISIDQRTTTDDCVSTIYELQTNALTPVRRYLTAPNNVAVNDKISVESTVFAVGQTYIIGVACHHGLHDVTTALDWSTATYPFVEAVTWSLPFTVH